MAKLILYNADLSPPVRTVKTVAKLISVDLELRNVDLIAGDHLKESYTKLNPEHTVPTLVNVDENFAIWDSHAICCYLIDKFANDDKLYPKDLQLRAKCNQRMFFDAASLFICLRDINAQVVWKGATEIPQDKLDAIQKAYNILELFLVSDPFLVGQNLTIADISAATSVLALETYAQVNANKHPNIIAWLHRVRETIPFFDEINGETTKSLREILLGILEKNRSQSSK